MSSLFGIGAGSASTGFYSETIDQSLRFNSGSNSRMSVTVGDGSGSGGGNRRTYTLSVWIKRTNPSGADRIFEGYTSASQYTGLGFDSSGRLRFDRSQDGVTNTVYSNSIFRDATNWYHVVWAIDTEQSTASNRVRFYVNGTEITDKGSSGSGYPAEDLNTIINLSGQSTVHAIGKFGGSTGANFDGYMAEMNFIDGTQLTPSSFGETKNGVWIPKSVSGLTYGTLGFRLTFADSSDLGNNANSTDGTNDFTTISNIDSTDVVLDSPTNNFCTLNPIIASGQKSSATYSEGNLKYTSTDAYDTAIGTIGVSSGKWYYETKLVGNGNQMIGLRASPHDQATSFLGQNTSNSGIGHYRTVGVYNESSGSDSLFTAVDGDVIGIAFDADNGYVWFSKNGSFYGTVDTSSNRYTLASWTSGEFLFPAQGYRDSRICNFGQDASFVGTFTGGDVGTATDGNGKGVFKYAPPSGYLALCSANLPDTTIAPNQEKQGSDFNQVVFYNGNSSNTHQITGVGFKPDMVHIKVRNQSASHYNIDSRRGIGTGDSFKALAFNTSAQEYSAENDQLRSLDADGFTLDNNADTTWYVNRSSDTYNSWNWRCGSDTPNKTYKVVVVSDSGNKYRFRNSADDTTFAQSAVTLDLTEGGTYIFDWSDSTAQGHPIRFSTTSDGTHGGGSAYTTGVVNDDSNYKTTITIASSAPTLYYYCANHSGMGGQINTNPLTEKGETNFDGTILSVTQVNNDIGMSIATYTAPSGTFYFGHGLSQAPEFFMVKSLGGIGNWIAYHEARTPSVPNTKGLYVNSPSLPTTNSNWIQEVSATRIGITTGQLTGTGDYLLYAWHSVEGYCKVGQYEGKNSTDNAFVYTGFLPNIIWIKNVDSGHDWVIRDLKHSGYYTDGRTNPVTIGSSHSKNNPHTGGTSFMMDFLSNGFKIRGNNSDIGSSHTFMYIAWASDQTFKFSNAR